MPRYLTAAFLAAVSCSAANAQTSVSPTTTKPAPAASADSSKGSVSTRVENWTEVQWESAKIEWAKDSTKWAKLPEAVERTKTRGSEELAGPLQVHDRVRGLTGPAGSPPWSILLTALIFI
jgi:hypothetical protein